MHTVNNKLTAQWYTYIVSSNKGPPTQSALFKHRFYALKYRILWNSETFQGILRYCGFVEFTKQD